MAEINDVTVRIIVDDSELQEKRELKIEVDDKELQDLRKLAEVTGKDLQDLMAIKDKTSLEPMGMLAFAGIQNQSMFRRLSSQRIFNGLGHIGAIITAFQLGELTGELIKLIIREIEANRSVVKDETIPPTIEALRQPSPKEPISFQEITKKRGGPQMLDSFGADLRWIPAS